MWVEGGDSGWFETPSYVTSARVSSGREWLVTNGSNRMPREYRIKELEEAIEPFPEGQAAIVTRLRFVSRYVSQGGVAAQPRLVADERQGWLALPPSRELNVPLGY
jgi:hypothetical protein